MKQTMRSFAGMEVHMATISIRNAEYGRNGTSAVHWSNFEPCRGCWQDGEAVSQAW